VSAWKKRFGDYDRLPGEAAKGHKAGERRSDDLLNDPLLNRPHEIRRGEPAPKRRRFPWLLATVLFLVAAGGALLLLAPGVLPIPR